MNKIIKYKRNINNNDNINNHNDNNNISDIGKNDKVAWQRIKMTNKIKMQKINTIYRGLKGK